MLSRAPSAPSGVIQCTDRDEFSYQEMITHLPVCSLRVREYTAAALQARNLALCVHGMPTWWLKRLAVGQKEGLSAACNSAQLCTCAGYFKAAPTMPSSTLHLCCF